MVSAMGDVSEARDGLAAVVERLQARYRQRIRIDCLEGIVPAGSRPDLVVRILGAGFCSDPLNEAVPTAAEIRIDWQIGSSQALATLLNDFERDLDHLLREALPSQSSQAEFGRLGGKLQFRQAAALLCVGVVAGAGMLGILSRPSQREAMATAAKAQELARETRRALANSYLATAAAPTTARDEALPYLLAALEQDPANLDAQALLLATLRATAWNFPRLEIRHPSPLRAISFGADPDTLFAACRSPDEMPESVLRWDLRKPVISGILATRPAAPISMLSVSPSGKRMVVRRTRRETSEFLLCDAETIRIIAILPVAPDHEIPASCFAWSPDGLLLAHPAAGPEPSSLIWRIIDSTRGRSIRESDPSPVAPLAAQLDVFRLRALAVDGSLLELPLQSSRPSSLSASSVGPFDLAVFSPDGGELLARPLGRAALIQHYSLRVRSGKGHIDLEAVPPSIATDWTSARSLLSRLPGLGNGLLGRDTPPRLLADDSRLVLLEIDGRPDFHAPFRAASSILSAAFSNDRVALGTDSGQLLVHEILPRLGQRCPPADAAPVDSEPAIPDSPSRRNSALLAAIPIPDVRSVHRLASRGWLAVATANEVQLLDERDFSLVARLPTSPLVSEKSAPVPRDAWAEDATRGWLACRRGRRLDLWSLNSRQALVAGIELPESAGSMSFAERDGILGLAFQDTCFLPLARTAGMDPRRLAALRYFVGSVAGIRSTADPRSPEFLAAADRIAHATAADPELLEALLPGAGAVLDRILRLGSNHRSVASPELWMPLWERLVLDGDAAHAWVTTAAAGLGREHPWFQAFLRGRIAASDQDLYRRQRGIKNSSEDALAFFRLRADEIARLHQIVGDREELQRLKRAAWQALAQPPIPSDLKSPTAILDAHVAATHAAWQLDPSPAHAIEHAEALALRGQRTKAADFLRAELRADVSLTLSQAHFLLASGLADACPGPLEHAVEKLDSPWLWSAWLTGANSPELATRVARVMQAVDGQGLAAITALHQSLRAGDSAAIARALEFARELPSPIREHATARALWAQGRSAEVFALWPGELPRDHDFQNTHDWRGWENALPDAERKAFLAELQQQLDTLQVGPGASPADLRALAERLLDPATRSFFGSRRVRDAMVACGLALAHEPGDAKQVARLLDSARLAGADPLDCLRIEARSLMATGNFSAAYGRWLQVIDPQATAARASDHLEAARCVLHDAQDIAAVELLLRGKDRFPADPLFAHEAAWLLLGAARPEEAGILLEHGFTIPFTAEQMPIALAMLVCAAEQTGRGERADQTFRQLVAAAPDWGDSSALEALDWPAALRQCLLAVAARKH